MYKNYLKGAFDFFLAMLGFIILFPVFLLVMVFLFFANKGTPFFFQKRPGKNEKTFYIIKFKTMNDKKDMDGKLLPDKDRLTKIGAIVRKSSLDEIPQLINVIKGDMSLIGPRPLLCQYLPYYTEREKKRHLIKPGITGYAQVNGRNSLAWDERLELDVYYVENLSFWLDVKILWKTLLNVVRGKDVVVIPSSKFMTLDNYRKNEIKG